MYDMTVGTRKPEIQRERQDSGKSLIESNAVQFLLCFCSQDLSTDWIKPVQITRPNLLYLKLTIDVASGHITSWEIDGEAVETMSDYFFGLQNHCR